MTFKLLYGATLYPYGLANLSVSNKIVLKWLEEQNVIDKELSSTEKHESICTKIERDPSLPLLELLEQIRIAYADDFDTHKFDIHVSGIDITRWGIYEDEGIIVGYLINSDICKEELIVADRLGESRLKYLLSYTEEKLLSLDIEQPCQLFLIPE